MGPTHPEWAAFCDALAGEGYCNVTGDRKGWHCQHDLFVARLCFHIFLYCAFGDCCFFRKTCPKLVPTNFVHQSAGGDCHNVLYCCNDVRPQFFYFGVIDENVKSERSSPAAADATSRSRGIFANECSEKLFFALQGHTRCSHTALEKYGPGRSEPILVKGNNRLKPANHQVILLVWIFPTLS